ncbi:MULTISPECIES: hypothetical protein [Nostocales]|jgi:hypothetical protein|uniref:Uncharacterized protein n=1 Tax=Dolichospermum flos-aquae UHCC 0037 TaxID=2590026 RepID=A0ACC7S8K1_DOLFA|nr:MULTISPECIES: hypothetical protein [Nostocales]MBO1065135.1 hypothetical protein [Anabaena sp. 54]MTJ44883.1 hypothetical protein [Dolichospermum flos-aquae UHCC 0037]
MNNLVNSLLHYTDEDILYDVLIERYRRLSLCRYVFLSLFPKEDKANYNEVFNKIGEEAELNDVLITEQIVNFIENKKYSYSSELKVVAVYLVYGNPQLEKNVCSAKQLEKAKNVATKLVSDRIWELAKNPL